jgi:hypothetical protein
MPDNTLDNPYPVGSPEWRWLEAYGDMKESSELSSLSPDSLLRNHRDKIRRLGPRRLGMSGALRCRSAHRSKNEAIPPARRRSAPRSAGHLK